MIARVHTLVFPQMEISSREFLSREFFFFFSTSDGVKICDGPRYRYTSTSSPRHKILVHHVAIEWKRTPHARIHTHPCTYTGTHIRDTSACARTHIHTYIYTHTYACARRVSACIDAQCFCRVKHCRVITISTFLAHAKLSPFFFLPFFSRFFFSKRNKREKMKMELSTGFTGRLMWWDFF